MGSLGTPVSKRWPNPPVQDSVFKMFDMTGKVTICTGGSGGIGYEICRGLAEAGSNIALWYHKSPNASKLAATIEKDFNIKCKAYQCDVAEYGQVKLIELPPSNPSAKIFFYRSKAPYKRSSETLVDSTL